MSHSMITQPVSATHSSASINTPVANPATQAVDNDSINAFQRAMQTSPPIDQASPVTGRIENIEVRPVAEVIKTACLQNDNTPCLGDKILDGMEKLKSSHDAQVNAINQSLEVDLITTQDIFALQLDLAKLQIQEELMAKTATKSTQNIDTLLKAQ